MSDWIRREERLPAIDDQVWVGGYDVFPYVTVGILGTPNRDGGENWEDEFGCDNDGNREELYGVTHWMPFEMPDPPPAKNDE